MVATRAKPDEIMPELSVQKRALLYCIASGTRGGAPASRMRPRKLVRGLIDRDAGPRPNRKAGLNALRAPAAERRPVRAGRPRSGESRSPRSHRSGLDWGRRYSFTAVMLSATGGL